MFSSQQMSSSAVITMALHPFCVSFSRREAILDWTDSPASASVRAMMGLQGIATMKRESETNRDDSSRSDQRGSLWDTPDPPSSPMYLRTRRISAFRRRLRDSAWKSALLSTPNPHTGRKRETLTRGQSLVPCFISCQSEESSDSACKK